MKCFVNDWFLVICLSLVSVLLLVNEVSAQNIVVDQNPSLYNTGVNCNPNPPDPTLKMYYY